MLCIACANESKLLRTSMDRIDQLPPGVCARTSVHGQNRVRLHIETDEKIRENASVALISSSTYFLAYTRPASGTIRTILSPNPIARLLLQERQSASHRLLRQGHSDEPQDKVEILPLDWHFREQVELVNRVADGASHKHPEV